MSTDPQQKDSIEALASQVQALGVGYSRMEQCVMDLVREIRALVVQNAALLEAMAEQEREDDGPVGYLSSKRR